MKNIFYSLLFLVSTACSSPSGVPPVSGTLSVSGVPVSVSHIDLGLVGDRIVRVIQHNMELNPIVQIEVLSRPDYKIINATTITELPFGVDDLSLKNSSGAFVEELSINDDHVNMVFEYFPLKGSSIMLSCNLAINADEFSKLKCVSK